MGNSPIRGCGWCQVHPYGDYNGRKLISVGAGGDVDGSLSPDPNPRIPAPVAAV